MERVDALTAELDDLFAVNPTAAHGEAICIASAFPSAREAVDRWSTILRSTGSPGYAHLLSAEVAHITVHWATVAPPAEIPLILSALTDFLVMSGRELRDITPNESETP
jgi:hypothetical protein